MLNHQQLVTQIRLCGLNRRKAQKLIYDEFFDRARRICDDYISDSQELITVINEGFLNVYRYIHRFNITKGDVYGSFCVWLDKMVFCAVVSHFRQLLELTEFLETDTTALIIISEFKKVYPAIQPADFLQQYRKITASFRIVIVLHQKYNMQPEELAISLGISIPMAQQLLTEADKEIKALFNTIKEEKSAAACIN